MVSAQHFINEAQDLQATSHFNQNNVNYIVTTNTAQDYTAQIIVWLSHNVFLFIQNFWKCSYNMIFKKWFQYPCQGFNLGSGSAVQCSLWSKLPSVSKKGKERDIESNQKHVNIIVNILPLWLNQTHAGYKNSERDLSSVVFLFFNTTEGCCGQRGEPSKPQRSSSVSYSYSHKLNNIVCVPSDFQCI